MSFTSHNLNKLSKISLKTLKLFCYKSTCVIRGAEDRIFTLVDLELFRKTPRLP